MRGAVTLATLVCGLVAAAARPAGAVIPYGTYRWPVTGPVIRPYEQPTTPFSAGHRGIDIAAPFGTRVRAPAEGTVTFAGWVAGSQFLTIGHGDGIKTSYSWLSGLRAARGDSVKAGDVIALTGHGHPEVSTPHLHFSVRIDGVYVDPMLLLAHPDLTSLIHLAPLSGVSQEAGSRAPPRMGAPIEPGCVLCQSFREQAIVRVRGRPAEPFVAGPP